MYSQLFLWIALGLLVVVNVNADGTTPCVGDGCARSYQAHQKKCTSTETKQAACLNGECYALELGGSSRSLFCKCQELYQGTRCEQVCAECYVRVMTRTAEVHPGVWVAVALGVLAIIVVIIVIVVLVKRRRERRNRNKDGDRPNGANGAPTYSPVPKDSKDSNGSCALSNPDA